MDYCSNESRSEIFATLNQRGVEIAPILYKYLCPPLLITCALSVIINVVLFIVGHLKTRNKSPVLLLSLNLSSTDAFASLFVGIGLVFNSYLPVVFNIHFNTCPFLAFEIARTSSLIASAFHLLVLAFVHYKGITKPLHYRAAIFCSYHVKRSIDILSLVCWLTPCITFSVYFFSVPCQGFRSQNCDFLFLLSKKYRILIFAMFFIPLLLMLLLYTRIFHIIKKRNCKQSTEDICVSGNQVYLRRSICEPKTEINSANGENLLNYPVSRSHSFDGNSKNLSLQCNRRTDQKRESNRASKVNSVQTATKALVTSLMILGTYLVCYMPALTFYALTCIDGCPFPLFSIAFKTRILVSFVCNSLVILKAIIDPLIYTFRMKEIKIALSSVFNRNATIGKRQYSSTSTRFTSTSRRSNKSNVTITRV